MSMIEYYKKEIDKFGSILIQIQGKQEIELPELTYWGSYICDALNAIDYNKTGHIILNKKDNLKEITDESIKKIYEKLPSLVKVDKVYVYGALPGKYVRFNKTVILGEENKDYATEAAESIQKGLSIFQEYVYGKKIEEMKFQGNVDNIRNICNTLSLKITLQNVFNENDEKVGFAENDVWNELLQNANDKINDGKLYVKIDEKNSVTFSYKEKSGFTVKDYYAISTSGNSGNLGNPDRLSTEGKKGTGFKSIYRYFDVVEIDSAVKIGLEKSGIRIKCRLDRNQTAEVNEGKKCAEFKNIEDLEDEDRKDRAKKCYPIPKFEVYEGCKEHTTVIKLSQEKDGARDFLSKVNSNSFVKRLLFLNNISDFQIENKGSVIEFTKEIKDDRIEIRDIQGEKLVFSGHIYESELQQYSSLPGAGRVEKVPDWVENGQRKVQVIFQDSVNESVAKGMAYQYTTLPWETAKNESTYKENIYINNPWYDLDDKRSGICFNGENENNLVYNEYNRYIWTQVHIPALEAAYKKIGEKIPKKLYRYSIEGAGKESLNKICKDILIKAYNTDYEEGRELTDKNQARDIWNWSGWSENDKLLCLSKWILGKNICENTKIFSFSNINFPNLTIPGWMSFQQCQKKIKEVSGIDVILEQCEEVFTKTIRTELYTYQNEIVDEEDLILKELLKSKAYEAFLGGETQKLSGKGKEVLNLFNGGCLRYRKGDRYISSNENLYFSRSDLDHPNVVTIGEGVPEYIPQENNLDKIFSDKEFLKKIVESTESRVSVIEKYLEKEFISIWTTVQHYLNELADSGELNENQQRLLEKYLEKSVQGRIKWKKIYKKVLASKNIKYYDKKGDQLNVYPKYEFDDLSELDASLIEQFEDRVDEKVRDKEETIIVDNRCEMITLDTFFKEYIRFSPKGANMVVGDYKGKWCFVVSREDAIGSILSKCFNCNDYVTPQVMKNMDCTPADVFKGSAVKTETLKKDLVELIKIINEDPILTEKIQELRSNNELLKDLFIRPFSFNNHEYMGYGAEKFKDKRCPVCKGIMIAEKSNIKIRNIQIKKGYSVPFFMCENCYNAVKYAKRVWLNNVLDKKNKTLENNRKSKEDYENLKNQIVEKQSCELVYEMHLQEKKSLEVKLSFFHLLLICKCIDEIIERIKDEELNI